MRRRPHTIALVVFNVLGLAYVAGMLWLMCGCIGHRDVKPANVLSNRADPEPVYMAPEQANRCTNLATADQSCNYDVTASWRWDDFTRICVADCGCDSYCLIPACGWPVWDGCHWNCGGW